MRRALLAAALSLAPLTAQAQFELQDSHTTASLRGIHSLGNGVAWASGTEGTILHTTDDGNTWQRCATPPEADKLDFRGIQAFDQNTAIVMSSGKGDLSRLYKTTDGCKTWKLVFTNPDKDGFWDAIQFVDRKKGILLGDPVQNRFVVFQTYDGGLSWLRFGTGDLISPAEGVGAFAASNTSLVISYPGPMFGTGKSYFYRGEAQCTAIRTLEDPNECLSLMQFDRTHLPIRAENTSSGIFSLARSEEVIVAVGGDYTSPDRADFNATYSRDEGKTWQPSQATPHGYRSSVAYDALTKTWITTGPNGTDISRDDGRNWSALKPSAEDAPDADKNWNALSLPFVVGPKGRIGRLRNDALKP